MQPREPRPRTFCCLAALACASLSLACREALTVPPPPQGGGPCADLAYAFFVVADKRDHGSTREEQMQEVRAGIEGPFAVHPERTLADLQRVVDLVYRRPDVNAREIEALVREHCVVDERGQPLLRTSWPRQRPRAAR